MAGETIRSPVQLAVGQRGAVDHERDRVGRSIDLILEETVHGSIPRIRSSGGVPLDQELVSLGVAQQAQVRYPASRLGHHALEQGAIVVRQARHRRRLEQVTSVLEGRAQRTVDAVANEQRQVERRRDRGERDVANLDRVLQNEADLEHRVLPEQPLRLQLLHELLERHVRMGVSVEARPAHARQKTLEGRVVGHVGAEDQGIDEESDDRLELHVTSVRNRRAHHDVVLAGGAGQEHREDRQHGHEERGVLTAAQRAQAVGQRARYDEVVARRGRRRWTGSRMIGRELERIGQAGQALAPVPAVTIEDLVAEPMALPEGEVHVPDRKLRQGRGALGDPCLVERGQVPDEDAQRPPVRDDVVDHDTQLVVVGPEPDQHGPEERSTRQGKRAPGLLANEPPRGGRARGRRLVLEAGDLQGYQLRGTDSLHGRAVRIREGRSQRLVPLHEIAEGLGERRDVQRAPELLPRRDGVGRGAGLELVEEPQSFLGEGEREVLLGPRMTRDARQGREVGRERASVSVLAGHAKPRHQLALAEAELGAQRLAQGAPGRAAAQAIAVDGQPDVERAKVGNELGRGHAQAV